MPSSLQRAPLQQPVLGLQADRPQRFVDAQGLSDAQNVMFVDGLFRTRHGFREPFVTATKTNPNTGGPVVSFLQYNYENIPAASSEPRRFLVHTVGEQTAVTRKRGTGLSDLAITGSYVFPYRYKVKVTISATGATDTCVISLTYWEDTTSSISMVYDGPCKTTPTPIGRTGLLFSFASATGHTLHDSWECTSSQNGWRVLDKATMSWVDLCSGTYAVGAGFDGELSGGIVPTLDACDLKVQIDTPTAATFEETYVDVATNRITFPTAHGLGANSQVYSLRVTKTEGTTMPAPLVSGSYYTFSVLDENTLECTTNITSTGSADLKCSIGHVYDTYKWSLDGGDTWEAEKVVAALADTTLGTTGAYVKFNAITAGSSAYGSSVTWLTAPPLTGGRTNPTIFRTFVRGTPPNAYVLGTNGIDAPKVWDGTSTVYRNISSLAGTETPPAAKCMVVSANRVILGGLPTGNGLSLGPSGIIISDDMDFDSQTTGWGGTSGTLVQLLDTPGDIVAMQEFGNLYFVVYKEDSIYLAMAQADTAPFRFELKKSGLSGPCSSRSVVQLPNGSHAYLARDGSIFVFDGNSVEPIGGVNEWRKIQALVLRTLDTLHPEYAWGMFDNEQQMLYFFWKHKGDGAQVRAGVAIDIPTFSAWPIATTNIDVAFGARAYLTFDTTIGELTGAIGTYVNKIGDWSTERPGIIYGGGDGKCYSQGGSDDNGTAIEAFWETGLNDFGDVITSKTVAETQHLFLTPQEGTGTTNVSVQIGYSDYGEQRNLTDAQVVDATEASELPGYGPRSLGHRITARMISVRFSASCSRVLAWIGSTLSYVTRGQR